MEPIYLIVDHIIDNSFPMLPLLPLLKNLGLESAKAKAFQCFSQGSQDGQTAILYCTRRPWKRAFLSPKSSTINEKSSNIRRLIYTRSDTTLHKQYSDTQMLFMRNRHKELEFACYAAKIGRLDCDKLQYITVSLTR